MVAEHKIWVTCKIYRFFSLYCLLKLTLIFQSLLVSPVRTAVRLASSDDSVPASIYMCDPVLTPQIVGKVVPLVDVVPVAALVAYNEKA